MPANDIKQLAKRIDTVVDILVGGDTASAINNLEILKADLLAQLNEENRRSGDNTKAPWEI